LIKQEVPISEELLKQVLASLSKDSVLVGGQALAYWVSYYGVQLPSQMPGAISDDADILGSREDVLAIASKTHGLSELQPQRSLSALVGHVTIPVSETTYVNVDVLHRLVGVKSEQVREHASEVQLEEVKFRVMHPIDVLISRVENLAILSDKQNNEGVTQMRLAIMVMAQYVREVFEYPDDGERHAMKVIEKVVSIARTGSGRKCSRDFGISFVDALPGFLIVNPSFRKIRWPQILSELGK
jgi:hypothetical protein